MDDKRKAQKARASKRAHDKKLAYMQTTYGDSCFFCGHKKVGIIHRKDGQPHKRLSLMSWKELIDVVENHRDEYVRVCGLCHAGVHWCMNVLRMTWDDIVARKL